MAPSSPKSDDVLVPEFESPNRKSDLFSSTFNLSATIVGGGVLSIPLAFERCGIVLGSILMIIAAIVTERSLYLLCLCSRISGATSYGEVGNAAFGKSMEYFVSILLFVLLQFALVAYMVLVQDIWTSVLHELWISAEQEIDKTKVLLAILIIMTPFFVQDTLYALRFNCYVGLASVSILCLALCHHAAAIAISSVTAAETTANFEEQQESLTLWSNSPDDILFAFPIITLSFVSIFNVLPIQNSLRHPTRKRIRVVIDGAIGSSFVLMLLFGLGGYLYARDRTDGNILNNVTESGDWFFFFGRLGCGITIMLALAMILLPCRSCLIEVIQMFLQDSSDIDKEEIASIQGQTSTQKIGEDTPLLESEIGDSTHTTPDTTTPRILQHSERGGKYYWLLHYGSTFGILSFCYIIAIHVPGVAVVWSLCGSFLAFLISFILPSVFYLKLQKEQPALSESAAWVAFSWFLLVSSTIAAIACTIQITLRFIHEL